MSIVCEHLFCKRIEIYWRLVKERSEKIEQARLNGKSRKIAEESDIGENVVNKKLFLLLLHIIYYICT